MSARLFDLGAERAAREPHLSGGFFCMACDHRWQGVAPHWGGKDQTGNPGADGTEGTPVQCPACKAERGYLRFDFMPTAGQLWTCTCENQLFAVTLEGIFCPRCGTHASFPGS